MNRIAVFVDAAYLLAAGGQAISGAKQRRADLLLDERAVASELTAFATSREDGSSFLRIYWYDGLGGGKETLEQRRIAETDNVKVRFGVINSSGEQKGVDSLIVTDLVDLSRSQAIASALLVGGDEDLRIGVEIAQRYGVRVHLLGVVPSRGNQSPLLRREADTLSEWDAEKIATFLRVFRVEPPAAAPEGPDGLTFATWPVGPIQTEAFEPPSDVPEEVWVGVAASFAAQVSDALAAEIVAKWDAGNGIDPIYDRRLLGAGGAEIETRRLDATEKRALREAFIAALRPEAA